MNKDFDGNNSQLVDPRRIGHETPRFARSSFSTPHSILPKVTQVTFYTFPANTKISLD